MNTTSESRSEECPEIPKPLLDYLRKVFPNTFPRDLLKMTDRQIGVAVGQQEVVEFLEAQWQNQIEK